MNENGSITMSPHLGWNILLGELAAELVGFHVHCLQTKWDLDSFVSVALAHSDTRNHKIPPATQHTSHTSLHTLTHGYVYMSQSEHPLARPPDCKG